MSSVNQYEIDSQSSRSRVIHDLFKIDRLNVFTKNIFVKTKCMFIINRMQNISPKNPTSKFGPPHRKI